MPVVGSTITRQARRLYVGNIPFGVTEVLYFMSIGKFFSYFVLKFLFISNIWFEVIVFSKETILFGDISTVRNTFLIQIWFKSTRTLSLNSYKIQPHYVHVTGKKFIINI